MPITTIVFSPPGHMTVSVLGIYTLSFLTSPLLVGLKTESDYLFYEYKFVFDEYK